MEGTCDRVVPPPHAQHASFAVLSKCIYPLPYVSQLFPCAYHLQSYNSPSASNHPSGVSVQPLVGATENDDDGLLLKVMLGIPVGMALGLVEEDLDGLTLEGVGAGLNVSLLTLIEGVTVFLVPPPHAQHASFAVVPKFS